MGKFQIYQDGRAAGANPISGSDFVTKDYLESHSGIELDPVYKADSGSLKASASLASASNAWITLNSGSLAISMSYDSDQKKIKLFSSGSTVVAEVDATDFIKDGMVNTITLDTSSLDLTITFNTDAGKEDIVVPMRNVFDLTMFYTKDETYSRDEIATLSQPFVSASNWIAENSASLMSGSVIVLPVDNSTWDAEANAWNVGTEFVSEVSAALADGKAIYLAVTTVDGTIYPAFTLNMGTLYGFGGITMPGDPSVVHTWQLQTGTGTLTYITASVQKHIPGLESWVTQYSESLVQTEQWVADSGSVAMSASLWTIQNSASLVASASLAEIAFSSSVAISSKTGSYDALMGLPAVTAADNGKILRVVSGSWALEMPIAVYNGSAAPSDNLGNNGDIYLQTS